MTNLTKDKKETFVDLVIAYARVLKARKLGGMRGISRGEHKAYQGLVDAFTGYAAVWHRKALGWI